jgi:hypothetical protein
MIRQPLPVLPATGPKEADPDDPMELVGVRFPVDETTFDEMASCLVEEYQRDGWTDEQLLTMFRTPFYAGLHVIWRRRGDAWVKALIAASSPRWTRPGPARSQETD